jgi:hypothetical protein
MTHHRNPVNPLITEFRVLIQNDLGQIGEYVTGSERLADLAHSTFLNRGGHPRDTVHSDSLRGPFDRQRLDHVDHGSLYRDEKEIDDVKYLCKRSRPSSLLEKL